MTISKPALIKHHFYPQHQHHSCHRRNPCPNCFNFSDFCFFLLSFLSSMWEILFRFQAELRQALNPTQDASFHPQHPPDKPTFKVNGKNLFQFREGFIGNNSLHFFLSLNITMLQMRDKNQGFSSIKMGKSKSKYFTLYPFCSRSICAGCVPLSLCA